MRRTLLTLLIVAGISVSACTGNDKPAQKTSAEKAVTGKKAEWVNFNDGLARSAKEKKHMIVDFYTDWCHWCKVMDEKTFSDAKVNQKLLDRFVTVRIAAEDASQTATFKGRTFTNVELTRAFGVTGFPSLAFLNSDGEVITVVPGYVPPETFIYILDYMDKECYRKQVPFEEFMKNKGDCGDAKKSET